MFIMLGGHILSYTQPSTCVLFMTRRIKKISIPRVNPIPKTLNQVMPLPISLTGMLTHRHGQNVYGHFALGFWPSDPNFTIGSLSKCLQNLERSDDHMYGDLMHMHTPSRKSNLVLYILMSPHALERHMAIKNEQNVYCGHNACNGDN